MTTAREINKKLDEILTIQSQIKEIKNDLAPEAQLNDIESGEPVTKDFVLNKGQEQLAELEKELNQITNNGKNCRDIFTNQYYINDFSQDKLIAKEIRDNKLASELGKQKAESN